MSISAEEILHGTPVRNVQHDYADPITIARLAILWKITCAEFSPKLRISKPQSLNLIQKSDLAAVGHGLELPAFFPRFLLVPRHGGSAMIVWIADEGGLLLCCA